ncbi:hypothetical protein MB02_11635 [Croceicoccus estronivorus]|uniref:nuclear transport factor 2 family protein n=1 Tax=Croceicoccus estronivorus TaxID=1172626 RepID=UPI000837896B|nr:nuclear transport factor 2 family protein [Croceicoccus estronivorus]OCC23286.1 hypothetical protein MB02_11635 [Croceicoccus estronivorus]
MVRLAIIAVAFGLLLVSVEKPAGAAPPTPATTCEDRIQISDAINGLANATDRRDWEAAEALLAPEVDLGYRMVDSPAAPIRQRLTPAQFVEASRAVLPGYLHTQHLIGNLVVQVIGDHAMANSQVWMTHYLPNDQGEPYWNVAALYRHELERTPAGWKIAAMHVEILYQTGNTHLSALAAARVKAGDVMTTP